MNYTAYNVTTAFAVSGVTEYSETSIPLVSSIVYPDGSRYSFTYEYTPGSTTTYTGRIASVTLPTGGTISYAYTGGNHGIESDGSTSGLNRTTSDSSTPLSYLRSGVSSTASTTTYTDAYSPANTTVSTYLEDTQGYIYETSRSVYQGTASGTPLQQVTTCYAQVSGCPANSVTAPIGYVTTTLAQNGVPAVTDTQQYSGGFLIDNNDEVCEQRPPPIRGSRERIVSVSAVESQASPIRWVPRRLPKPPYAYDQTALSSFTGTPQPAAESSVRGEFDHRSSLAKHHPRHLWCYYNNL